MSDSNFNLPSKLEVNAAILSLIRLENIEESAQTIIRFSQSIPQKGRLSMHVKVDKYGTDQFSALTDHGAYSAHTEKKPLEKSWGEQNQRVGQFKLSRVKKDTIEFHHYWASDTATSVYDTPETYILRYDPENLQFKYFGIWIETKFRFWIIKLSFSTVKILYGEDNK